MTEKVNKYLYLYVLQGYYDDYHGWEDLCQSEKYHEVKAWKKDYRENDFYTKGLRIIQRREPNPLYGGPFYVRN